ncbi:hypothetical protein S140_179 [Shewanella sp. phage 1/40]|uniref:hypothetical protein n=1 Tax=Shewanella sp. phage 1/40 TaxID=1458860 RepID=UPI0004F62CD7|nr:hypothetical protein S140_179 [Shewanella sp. phage 1/40]AHK11586.1 hypothetical protein S140_179 [Shewanella sp. phage 1/40]
MLHMVAETLISNNIRIQLMQFEFVVETPKQDTKPQQQRESNIDWDEVNNYQAEVLGIGKHQLIGTISSLVDLGIQPRAEQVVLWDAKAQGDSGWRLEVYEDSGIQKDESARLEMRKYRGKEQECLVYQPKDVAQMAIAVDFPEKMMNLGKFFNPEGDQTEKPFRDIIGNNGFGGFRIIDGRRTNVIAKPFNLLETNVNSKKKDTPAHFAFAKNSMLYSLADYCGVLDDNENFHIKDIGKLLGKVCMFEVEVKWNTWKDKTTGEEKRKLETNILPSSRMSPRDLSYFESDLKAKIDQDGYGGLLFSGGNRERDLKEARAAVINTMQLATNWDTSKLKGELEAVKSGGGNGGSSTPQSTTEASKPVNVTKVADKPQSAAKTVTEPLKVTPDSDDDWDEQEIPF